MILSSFHISRFDRAVGITAVLAVLLVAFMLWQSGAALGATTKGAGILYIAWEEDLLNQIYLVAADAPVQLTAETGDVLNFAVSPDGTTLAYTVGREDGRSDLWAVGTNGRLRRRLLICDDAVCSQPRWSPDGQRLVYERRHVLEPNAPPGSPRLWWLDVASGETLPVFADSQWLGWGAEFSPNGRWLSYVSPISQEIQVYNLETGQTVRIPSRSGETAVWGPDSDTILVTDIQIDEDRFAVHLFRVNLSSGETTNLSGAEAEVNDSLPAWSPDGQWIAFTRKTPRAAEGKQVWLMAADGSNPMNVTQKSAVHFGTPSWSPDSLALTFQGYELAEPGAEPTIWRYDLRQQRLVELVSPGVQPLWIP